MRRLFEETVPEDCLRRLFEETVPEDCSRRLFQETVSEDCFRRLFQETVSEDCFRRRFQKTVSGGCSGTLYHTLLHNTRLTGWAVLYPLCHILTDKPKPAPPSSLILLGIRERDKEPASVLLVPQSISPMKQQPCRG